MGMSNMENKENYAVSEEDEELLLIAQVDK